MSAELIKARQLISQVRSNLKQGKIIPAAQGLHSAISIILSTPLMLSEKEEFDKLLVDATMTLANDALVRKKFPLAIQFKSGEERQLLDTLHALIDALQEETVRAAEDFLQKTQEHKRNMLAQAMENLRAGNVDAAKRAFNSLRNEFSSDPELMQKIGEALFDAQLFEDACEYLAKALELNPGSIQVYNRIGIALRKLGRFEAAERYYRKAIEWKDDDPNIFFNLGRLYVEWKQWRKAVKAAKIVLRLNPDFEPAQKLQAFAEKKLETLQS